MPDTLIPTDEIYTGTNAGLGYNSDAKQVDYKVFLKRHHGTPALVTFGKGGSSVYFLPRREGTLSYSSSTLQGYNTPEDFFATGRWWAHDYATRVDPEQYEGVPYIDMRKAVETAEGVKMAIAGPMVGITLQPEEVEKCPVPSDILAYALASDEGNQFGQLLTLNEVQRAAKKKYGALDQVDIATYQQLWRDAGAEVGTIVGGKFVPYSSEAYL